MDRRVALTVVVGIVVAGLLVTISTSGSVPLAERAPSMPFDLPELDLGQPTPTTLAPEPSGEPTGGTVTRSTDVISYLQNLALLGLILLIALGLKRAWEHRPELVWRPTRRRNDFVRLEEVAASIAEEAEAQRAALRHGEARNAIVACWSMLERSVVAAGLEHDPADTPTEFTVRVLARFPVDPAATDDLVVLYREARFSTHPMGEPERARALAALDALHAGLREAQGVAASP